MENSTMAVLSPTELLNGNIDGLSEKQSRFVLAYIDCHNLTEAAARAGYKGNRTNWASIGSRLIRIPKVTKAIREQLMAQSERTLITPDRLLHELSRIAFFDPGDCVGENGEVLSLKDMPANIRHAIAGIDVEEKTEWVNGKRKKTGELKKIRFWNKLDSLGKLMSHFGMTPKRTDLNIQTRIETQVTHQHTIALGNLNEEELSTLLKLSRNSQAVVDMKNKQLVFDGDCKNVVEENTATLPDELVEVVQNDEEDDIAEKYDWEDDSQP